jgi:8-oxo-dGTP pyrophosphatase MutT (NUDIX family)
MTEQITLRDGWGNLAVTLSCKAIAVENGMIWLRQNERGEWELPGGRLDESEQPEETIRRELEEELGAEIENLRLIDIGIWQKDFGTNTHIGIITFYCDIAQRSGTFENDGEAGAAEFKQYAIDEALLLPNLPTIYKRALRKL